MSRVVLDASALLAYFNGEPGAASVPVTTGEAAISSVNYAETIAVMTARGMSESFVRRQLSSIVLDIVDFDRACAERAGFMIGATKGAGLSLGDRACLATAAQANVPALTTDRSWNKVAVGVTVQLIR